MAVDNSHGIEVGQDIGTGNAALIITRDNNEKQALLTLMITVLI